MEEMNNNTHSHTNNLGVFGWNFSLITNLKLTTDNEGNVYISNLKIESLLPSQRIGTALYETSNSQTPLAELQSNPYSLNSQQLLTRYSANKRIFKRQDNGSFQGNSGTLTWKVNHYELVESNGTKVVFRPDGQLNYVEDSNGYRLTAGYTNDLLTELSASNGDGFTLDYNSAGRIETVSDNQGQVDTYSYDATGQYLLSVEDANGTTSFNYDNPFDPTLVTSVTYDDGLKVTYDYDHVGRLQQVIYGEGREALAYTYNYDDNGGVTLTEPGGGETQQIRNEQGQVSQTIDANGRTTNYSYDAAGNRTQTIVNGVTENYSTNNLNQYESAGTTTYSYDLDGNLISKTEGNQTWTYSYDDNNRLVEVIDSDNKLTQYEYDAFGNRTATIYNGQRTEYLIDPFGYGDVIAEYDGDGNLIAKYEHGIGLVSRTDASNNKAFYDFDGTGSTAALTGQAGNELNSYNYPPRRLQHSLCVLI